MQSPKKQTGSATRDDSKDDSLPPNNDGSNTQRFTIYVWPEPDFDPLSRSNNNIYSYSWPYKSSSNPSFASSALRDVVPKDMRGEALAQWGFDIDPEWPTHMTQAARLRMKRWIPSKMSERDDNEQDVDETNITENWKPRKKRKEPLVLDDEDDVFLSKLRASRRDG